MVNLRSDVIADLTNMARAGDAVLVEVVDAKGSTPREAGAWMAVSGQRIVGTIGGGQLEFIATAKARAHIGSPEAIEFAIPLGPEINQCCGGHVTLGMAPLTIARADAIAKQRDERAMPDVQIHGAGHTGIALHTALRLLPLNVRLIDSRADNALMVSAAGIEHIAVPETAVREAAPNTAFVVVTHSHDLDFLITAEALARGDAAYVGLIGSDTKRAVFARWLGENGYDSASIESLTCPIGAVRGEKLSDKRPEVIAALTAAELMTVFGKQKAAAQHSTS